MVADLYVAHFAAFDVVGVTIREDLLPLFTDRFGYRCKILQWVNAGA